MDSRARWIVTVALLLIGLPAGLEAAYVIVKTDGSRIQAESAFEVKDGMIVFRPLTDGKPGALSSLPVGDIDLGATEAVNRGVISSDAALPPPPLPPAPPPMPAPAAPNGGRPVFDTKEISSILESDAMRAERERIKQLRAEQEARATREWEAAHQLPTPTVATTPAVSGEEQALVSAKKIRRGMSAAGVTLSWGDADKKARLTEDGVDREVWTYLVKGKAPYVVTFAAGRVVQIQLDERLLFIAAR